MTTDPVVAEVECPNPECHLVVARVHQGPGGRLSVEHRAPRVSDNDRPVVKDARPGRPFRPWEVATWRITGTSWAGAECFCKNWRKCGAIFVLEKNRVRELAERSGINGALVHWKPRGVEVERSSRLRPTFDGSHWQREPRSQGDTLARLTRLSPPP